MLPREPLISDNGTGQAELGISADDQPCPAIRLFGMPYSRDRPHQRLFDKTEGML
jgi:hypothetical protein